jgi:hypothetical protein
MTSLPSKDVVSAGGVVVDDRPDGSRWVLLIVHRSLSGHPRWTLPKGGVEDGETVEQAALREQAYLAYTSEVTSNGNSRIANITLCAGPREKHQKHIETQVGVAFLFIVSGLSS